MEKKSRANLLGDSIKVAMGNANLTVTALHKRTGISRETIYRVLRGESMPSLEVLQRLAVELRVSLGELVDGKITPSKPGSSASFDSKSLSAKLNELQSRVERLEQSGNPKRRRT